MWVSVVIGPLVFGMLFAQGVGVLISCGGMALALMCGCDLDLPRAVAGRAPLLPWLTAFGGSMGAALLWTQTNLTQEVAATAFLLQWAPVAIYTAIFGRRLIRLYAPIAPAANKRPQVTLSSLLISVFDGAVLNAPFILSLPVAPTTAIQLALGNRLFVSSLAVFSLISSLMLTGDLQKIARRFDINIGVTFAATQFVAAFAIGSAYAIMYELISNEPIGMVAEGIGVFLLSSYVLHATAIRFSYIDRPRARIVLYGSALLVYGGVVAWLKFNFSVTEPIGVVPIVVSVVLALGCPAIMALLGQRLGAQSR